jgi:hypothetical protein
MSNINSFAENMNKLVQTSNNQLELLQAMQESMTTDATAVNANLTHPDDNTKSSYSIPSWNALTEQVKALKNSINALIEGKGIVSVGDGTSRTVKLSTIASTPDRITGLTSPTTFSIDPNWWFEDFMYPAAQVTLDLLGKIEDTADRVIVNRVILDYNDHNALSFYTNNLRGTEISYEDLIIALTNNNVVYTEDKEIINLPLNHSEYKGLFKVNDTKFIDGKQWYYLDTLKYKFVDTVTGYTSNSTLQLKVGDQLSMNDYLYNIIDINEADQRVRLQCTIGYSLPGTDSILNFYNDPWKEKTVNVKFSNNEINIIYVKGINENFNVIANEWSTPVMFISNDLIFDGDNTTAFNSYYNTHIVDWGAEMVGQAREKRVYAYNGLTPNAPFINADAFSVVQINTQINAALDSVQLSTLMADIETTKSRLASLKGTIDSLQTNLQTITDATEYKELQDQINSDINDYKQLQSSYHTALNNAQTLISENNGVDVKPKYHIRGFFDIPAAVYNGTQKQEVIGFEIAYRYIKEDTTGVDLKTFTYTDAGGATHTGVYSDWNLNKTDVLEKVFNDETNTFEWQARSISDSDVIKINQVDIPITKGEKVEFKVRSISEAGYPYNPLKSDWSNAVIIEFPSNLSTDSEISNLIKDINDEKTTITIDNRLDATGLTQHISDAQANINSVTNEYFKHKAENISYEFKDPVTKEIRSISVQEALDSIFAFITSFLNYAEEKQPTYSSNSINSMMSISTFRAETPVEGLYSTLKPSSLKFTWAVRNAVGDVTYDLNFVNGDIHFKPGTNTNSYTLTTEDIEKIYNYVNKNANNKTYVDTWRLTATCNGESFTTDCRLTWNSSDINIKSFTASSVPTTLNIGVVPTTFTFQFDAEISGDYQAKVIDGNLGLEYTFNPNANAYTLTAEEADTLSKAIYDKGYSEYDELFDLVVHVSATDKYASSKTTVKWNPRNMLKISSFIAEPATRTVKDTTDEILSYTFANKIGDVSVHLEDKNGQTYYPIDTENAELAVKFNDNNTIIVPNAIVSPTNNVFTLHAYDTSTNDMTSKDLTINYTAIKYYGVMPSDLSNIDTLEDVIAAGIITEYSSEAADMEEQTFAGNGINCEAVYVVPKDIVTISGTSINIQFIDVASMYGYSNIGNWKEITNADGDEFILLHTYIGNRRAKLRVDMIE